MEKNTNSLLLAQSPTHLAPRESEYFDLEPEGSTQLRDLFHILLKRKWWVLGSLAGAVAVAVLVIFLMTPIYKATTVLQITQDNSGPSISDLDNLSLLKGGQDVSKFQETQNKILTSRGVAARVIKALNLQEAPEFKAIAEKYPDAPPEKLESEMIDLFLDKLVVNPVKDTYLVEVAYKSQDRALAKRVAEVLGREYMQLAIDSRAQSFALVKDWLANQLQQMAEKVQASQRKLYEFGQKHDFYALEDKDNVILQKYIELSALVTKAQSERLAKEAMYKQIKEKGPDAPVVTNNPLIMNLRQELVAQNAKVSGLKQSFLPGHPQMQVEQAKLAELQGRLKGEVLRLQKAIKAEYESAVKAENLLTQAFQEQKGLLASLQNNLVDFQILKRDAQTTEKLYKALLERMGATTVASTMVAGTVGVIDPPEAPYDPYLPKPLLFLALSGVFGLFLGVGMAFLAEHLDNSIKTTEDVERVVQVPSLGVVPFCFKDQIGARGGKLPGGFRGLLSWMRNRTGFTVPLEEPDLMMLKQPRSAMAEAFRHLRTSLRLSVSGGPPEVIVITSPHPREGKSTISANLAVALAQDGHRVLMLDCDLRRPRLHQVFQLENAPGLTSHLTGNSPVELIVKPTKVDNLFLIPAGPIPPNPAELLNSQTFKNLLRTLRLDFHHIIIDTPPTLGFADARVVAPQADGVLLVVKHQSTSREAGKLARQYFTQVNARLLGMVLNQVGSSDLRSPAFHHQKYYDKYYEVDQTGGCAFAEMHPHLPSMPLTDGDQPGNRLG
uniref:non-specific protein-tyrosine kinase n=1 Tax=Desulfobacca acetoxidans TaxID=60893 RepID=A0A7C3V3Z3_9BACT